MALPPPKICRRIRMLHAMLGSSTSGEREAAHKKLTETLVEYGLSWNDLPEILAAVGQHRTSAAASTSPTAKSAPTSAPQFNVLDLVDRFLAHRNMIAAMVIIVFVIELGILALALAVWLMS